MDVESYYSEETDAAAAAMAAASHPKFGRIMAPFTALIHDATAAFFHPRREGTQRKRQRDQEGNERERQKDGEGRKEKSIKLFRQIDVLRAWNLAVVAAARRYRRTRPAFRRPSERAEGIHATRD